MGLLALAFADNAFKESGIQKPEGLFSLKIPHFKKSLAIQSRPEILETPIFRRQVNGNICCHGSALGDDKLTTPRHHARHHADYHATDSGDR